MFRVAIGDSILVGMERRLREKKIQCDGEVGRSFDQGLSILAKLALGPDDTALLILGTNHGIKTAQLAEAMLYADGADVWFMTVTGVPHASNTNTNVRAFCKARPRAHLLDWAMISAGLPIFREDGYHPTRRGLDLLAECCLLAFGAR